MTKAMSPLIALAMLASALLTTASIATATAAGADTAGGADAPTITTAFEWAINVERGANNLPPLAIDDVESNQARAWSSVMAFTGTLAEDPGLAAATAAYEPGWTRAGENVGVGATSQSIEAALMASPPHRANILGPYTHVGVGVVIAGGRLWITERFYG